MPKLKGCYVPNDFLRWARHDELRLYVTVLRERCELAYQAYTDLLSAVEEKSTKRMQKHIDRQEETIKLFKPDSFYVPENFGKVPDSMLEANGRKQR